MRTALEDDAFFVAITLPTVAPLPTCASGIAATQRWMNGKDASRASCARVASSTSTPWNHAFTGLPWVVNTS